MNAKWIALTVTGILIGGLVGAGVGLGYYRPAMGVVLAAAVGLVIGIVIFQNRRRGA